MRELKIMIVDVTKVRSKNRRLHNEEKCMKTKCFNFNASFFAWPTIMNRGSRRTGSTSAPLRFKHGSWCGLRFVPAGVSSPRGGCSLTMAVTLRFLRSVLLPSFDIFFSLQRFFLCLVSDCGLRRGRALH